MQLKIAQVTMDNREHYKTHADPIPCFGTAPEALLQGLSRLPETEVHVISCIRQPVGAPEKLAPNIFFHSLVVPKIGWMRTGFQGCVRAVRRKISEIQPDIVHGQGTESYFALAAVFSGRPNVTTIHGNMAQVARVLRAPPGSYLWLAARLENFALKRTGGVFCNSQHTEDLVRPRARRTWRVPNAVRDPFFQPLTNRSRPAKCRIVNVGVITENKRQLELLEVVRKLRAEGLEFEFIFVGEARPSNPYARAFLEQIAPLQQEGLAHYVGMKSASELVECFDGASALVHFPLEESFGLVVAEALARNLKLFASRVGGIVDVAGGVSDAEIFGAQDLAGLESAIGAWIRRGYPGTDDAGKLMRSRYHPDVVARRHSEIYREVLS